MTDTTSKYTVVLDWVSEHGDREAPIVWVTASDTSEAFERATQVAARHHVGAFIADYTEFELYEQLYGVALFHGHITPAHPDSPLLTEDQ